MNEDAAKVTGTVHSGSLMVDGLGVGDVGNIVLRDRQTLAENGIVIVVLTLDRYNNQLLAGPDIVTRGFVYVRESEELMEQAKQLAKKALQNCLDSNVHEWNSIKMKMKDSISDYIYSRTKRSPMILPIIMEVFN